MLQLSTELIKKITLAGNSAIVFALLFTSIWLGTRLIKDSTYVESDPRKLERKSLNSVYGFFLLSIGIAIRIGYWVPAVLLSEVNQNFHPWFLSNRWIMVLFSTFCIVTGAAILLDELTGYGIKFKISFIIIAFTLGILFVYIRGLMI